MLDCSYFYSSTGPPKRLQQHYLPTSSIAARPSSASCSASGGSLPSWLVVADSSTEPRASLLPSSSLSGWYDDDVALCVARLAGAAFEACLNLRLLERRAVAASSAGSSSVAGTSAFDGCACGCFVARPMCRLPLFVALLRDRNRRLLSGSGPVLSALRVLMISSGLTTCPPSDSLRMAGTTPSSGLSAVPSSSVSSCASRNSFPACQTLVIVTFMAECGEPGSDRIKLITRCYSSSCRPAA